jgi:hypothetical protein
LQSLGGSLDEFNKQIKKDDEEIATLYNEVNSKISDSSMMLTEAKTLMKDVLKTYEEFDGNVNQLKSGIGGFANSLLCSIFPPPISFVLNAKVDELLNT